MRKIVFIGLGGMFGALLRVGLINVFEVFNIRLIPINILLVNLLGCFLLGLFFKLSELSVSIDREMRLGITTGFIGALTTFSTLCKGLVELLLNANYLEALIYLIGSCLLGWIAIVFGRILAEKLVEWWWILDPNIEGITQ
jgi:CrcB protein